MVGKQAIVAALLVASGVDAFGVVAPLPVLRAHVVPAIQPTTNPVARRHAPPRAAIGGSKLAIITTITNLANRQVVLAVGVAAAVVGITRNIIKKRKEEAEQKRKEEAAAKQVGSLGDLAGALFGAAGEVARSAVAVVSDSPTDAKKPAPKKPAPKKPPPAPKADKKKQAEKKAEKKVEKKAEPASAPAPTLEEQIATLTAELAAANARADAAEAELASCDVEYVYLEVEEGEEDAGDAAPAANGNTKTKEKLSAWMNKKGEK